MHSDEFIYAASISANDRQKSEEHARARLALMGELHTSLSGSCEALLALDLAGIARGTREQVELSVQLARVMTQGNQRMMKDESRAQNQFAPTLAAASAVLEAETRDRTREELEQSQDRVLHALRLQSAILRRARAKLRVLANALAGPSVNYGPPRARCAAQSHTFGCERGEEI